MNIFQWVQDNWVTVMGILWGIDQLLKLIAPLTPWKVDDNIADIFGKLLARWLPKK